MSNSNHKGNLVTGTFFRLLPIQILLAAISPLNDMVSSLFASNSVGAAAMGAIGLYFPINLFITSLCFLMVCGSQILSGKFMGANQMDHTQSVFASDLVLALTVSAIYITVHVLAVMFGWLRIFTTDPEVLKYLNQYVIGKTIGILPLLMGQQLSAFLSLENKMKRTTTASIVSIIVNLVASYVFVVVLKLEAFGVSLASSVGLWSFFLVAFSIFLSGKSIFKLRLRGIRFSDIGAIFVTGAAGALTYIYQAVRGLIVNGLITKYAGSTGLSAVATVNSFLGLFWAIPTGMMTVSRMLMAVSIGEEDRKTLTDIMRNMFKCSLPLMTAIVAVIVVLAEPITNLYFHNPQEAVYALTVQGMRLMSMVMPVAVIEMHFMCYAQTSGKQLVNQIYALVDGVGGVVGFSLLLMPFMSVTGFYLANILNSAIVIVIALIYSVIANRRIPRNMDEVMVIPKNFGVSADERMEITITSMDEVVDVSQKVSEFCKARNIDERRTYLSSLFMEEMAGNVVDHGFHKDKKKNHSVGIRVIHKDNDVILRIKDDCVPFNPEERKDIIDPKDETRNMAIRMVYKLANKIEYQNILGLNVLTIRI
ncbi:MAG: ATP-binding protein [Spirochaetales bacterium]|nr:ATP-binding protein [Spirochaetales bacterium]